MQNLRSHLKFPVSIVTIAVLLAGCSSSDDDGAGAGADLTGIWTTATASVFVAVGPQTFTDHYIPLESLKDYYINELGYYSPSAVEHIVTQYENAIKEELVGSIHFKSDNTYELKFGSSGPDDGTWTLSGDGKILTLDPGTVDEQVLFVNLLRRNSCIFVFSQERMEKFDEDDTEDVTVRITITLTLMR